MRPSLIPLALAAAVLAPPAWSQPPTPPASFLAPPSTAIPPSSDQAAPNAPLTLEQALSIAFERSPLLAAARNEAAATEGELQQAGLLPNPSIDVSMDDRRKASRTTTTTLSMPIETGGKRGARVKAAGLARDIAQTDLGAARADLRSTVIAAFFDVATAQETVRVAQENAGIAQKALQLADKRVAAGKAPPLESNAARVELANARIETRAAEAALQTARRSLAVLWGDTVPDFSSVRGEIGKLPERGTLDELRGELAQSPRMQAGRLSVDLGAAQLEVEKSKRYPDITLNTGVARDYEAGRNKVQFGVGIPLPLFDRNQGNVYAATMRSYKARDQYRDLEARLAAELLQSVSQYDLATGTANDYRATVLPSARRAYDIALKGFEAGKVGYLQVLDAQRTRSQAELGYLAALTNAHQAWANIDRILGR